MNLKSLLRLEVVKSMKYVAICVVEAITVVKYMAIVFVVEANAVWLI